MTMYQIRYEGLCMQGCVRKNNEDNLLCAGRILPLLHQDETECLSGTLSASDGTWFAVFDGMGGAAAGEAASYLAAREMARLEQQKEDCPSSAGDLMDAAELCRSMNCRVLEYAESAHARGMGTTVTALFFPLPAHPALTWGTADAMFSVTASCISSLRITLCSLR